MLEPASGRSLSTYADWVRASALPFWLQQGFDEDRGTFHERLGFDQVPRVVPLRSMVQARQIYVYADAARRGWFIEGGAAAARAMDNLLDTYARSERDGLSFAFAADAQGSITSQVRDAYAHAFILFALAALYRLNGDDRLLDVADRTIRYLDAEMVDPVHGGLNDALPVLDANKRQNPHMHLLEAFLFLEEAAPGRGYLARAQGIVDLFQKRMFDQPTGCLPEYFEADWRNLSSERGTIWEPGHHFEWYWLLAQYERLGGTRPALATDLYAKAHHHGLTPTGLVWDEVSFANMQPVKRSTRLWPHTEAIKAALQADQDTVPGAAAFAGSMADALLATFLDGPFSGGWIDHRAEDGSPLVDYVPASSLYHLYLAATQVPESPAIASARS
jgi:mannose/cellobiose epimerase-like protein (N-acyl-D-glucosamine 2-epimerase family)